jgi:hypothetical protein
MEKLNEKEIEDIINNRNRSMSGDEIFKDNGILLMCISGLLFPVGLLNVYLFSKYEEGIFVLFFIIIISTAIISGLIGFQKYASPTGTVRRKYGKHFSEIEKKFLFENFEIPLCKTVLGNKIQKFWKETEKTDFTIEMRLKARYRRLKFYLERELPEEIRKYEESERKRKAAEYEEERIYEEKRKKEEERIEKQFEEYMDQYSTELETEKN